MYISDKLNEQQQLEFRKYLSKIIKNIKIIKTDKGTISAEYKRKVVTLKSNFYTIEEYFENEEEFKESGRRPLDDGYEKENFKIFKDGTVCARSFLAIPKNDINFEEKEIDFDVRLVAAYLLYPTVRKYAPNILTECLNADLQDYQTNNQVKFFLLTYKALNIFRKDSEVHLDKMRKHLVQEV